MNKKIKIKQPEWQHTSIAKATQIVEAGWRVEPRSLN